MVALQPRGILGVHSTRAGRACAMGTARKRAGVSVVAHTDDEASGWALSFGIAKCRPVVEWVVMEPVFRGAGMSVLYPSLEDLKVGQVIQMMVTSPGPSQVVAPVSGNNLGVLRAEIKPGVREIHLCKDERGKTGLRLQTVDKGLFVQLVQANTPASLVGLRFGDQILQIDGCDCAGWSTHKAHKALKKASAEKIVMIVRDRPFQRTVTMHKDSSGQVGFFIKKGKIVSVVKGSSAARNGLLTNHYVCEVNGQNVIGLKDKKITEILTTAGNVITLTLIPTVIYEHMVKKLSPLLLQHTMDHSIPDI
ncbi:Syntenin-2 [Microtus ochrogaster]|uniref:Syntenin-2 n=1 Tax=Microtus ochrogaster TaxID=79684 RepID=A0A8J6FYS6_MICOH|nr:Syntenin-2 [Microtus ochrogaster]